MIWFIFIFFSIVSFILFYYQRVKQMTLLERHGIPGPKPHFISGNMSDYNKLGYNECFNKWKAQYGRVFGYYLGAKPFIAVTDPELLKHIQVKDFQNFTQRPYIIPGGIYHNWKYHEMVTRVDAHRWKKMRTILGPWFTSLSLKSITPIINICIDEMLNKFKIFAQKDNDFNIYTSLEGMTIDAIDRSGFSIQTNIQQKSSTNPFFEATRGVFAIKPSQFLPSLLLCFPEFSHLINMFRIITEFVSDSFGKTSHGLLLKAGKSIVDHRLANKDKHDNNNNVHKDLLQAMIEWPNYNSGDNKKHESKNPMEKPLNYVELVANTVVIHEAAYESPANILGFIVHNLINYPEIQQKCYEEVSELFDRDQALNYNVMSGLEFLDAVINETFRLYPTDVLFVSRAAKRDYAYRSMIIPKGVDIRVPTYQLFRDEEFWSDPNQFIPQRFLDKTRPIDPVVFQPFGIGPRMCPGKRYGLLEIKLTLAKLLHNYKLITGTKSELGEIELDFKLITLSPKNGVYVKLIPRNN